MRRLSDEEREQALGGICGWLWEAPLGSISKSFKFEDFGAAFAFMTRVALLAEEADHHPDWSNSWNRVDIKLTTHSAGGLTRLDIDLAKKIDSVAGQLALDAGAQ